MYVHVLEIRNKPPPPPALLRNCKQIISRIENGEYSTRPKLYAIFGIASALRQFPPKKTNEQLWPLLRGRKCSRVPLPWQNWASFHPTYVACASADLAALTSLQFFRITSALSWWVRMTGGGRRRRHGNKEVILATRRRRLNMRAKAIVGGGSAAAAAAAAAATLGEWKRRALSAAAGWLILITFCFYKF